MFKQIIALLALAGALSAQTAPAPKAAPATKATPKASAPTSPVDDVIELVKGGMSESLIIKNLQRQNKPIDLTPADMLKLQKNGVSDNIIAVMIDPSASTAATPAPKETKTAAVAEPQPLPPAEVGAACPLPSAVSQAPNSQKRRLAVQAFDYSAVQTQVTAMFNNNVNIGEGIRAMLTAKMAQSKNVVLLEREKLKSVMAEQDLDASNRVKRGTGSKIGGITGADALLLGDIVIFGRDDTAKKSGAAAGARYIPGIGGIVGGAVDAKKTDKAVVAINLRLVDAETGEIKESAEARGESTRTTTNWGALAGTWRAGAGGASSMTSSDFQETIIGEATNDAVNKIVAFLDQKIPTISAKSRTIEGRVANIDGCTLYISVGGNDGVQVGDHFEIHQILKEVLDPDTKEVLDKQTAKVGDFIVSTVRDKVSIGQYGGAPLSSTYKQGYAARLVK